MEVNKITSSPTLKIKLKKKVLNPRTIAKNHLPSIQQASAHVNLSSMEGPTFLGVLVFHTLNHLASFHNHNNAGWPMLDQMGWPILCISSFGD